MNNITTNAIFINTDDVVGTIKYDFSHVFVEFTETIGTTGITGLIV